MYSTPVYSTAKAGYSTHPPFSDAGKSVGCIAGGIISAREIKIWRRKRQACASGTSAASLYFACAIPPAMQAIKSVFPSPHYVFCKIFLTQYFYASLGIIKVRHKVTCRLCECRFLTVNVANNRTLIFKAWILLWQQRNSQTAKKSRQLSTQSYWH